MLSAWSRRVKHWKRMTCVPGSRVWSEIWCGRGRGLLYSEKKREWGNPPIADFDFPDMVTDRHRMHVSRKLKHNIESTQSTQSIESLQSILLSAKSLH